MKFVTMTLISLATKSFLVSGESSAIDIAPAWFLGWHAELLLCGAS
jgi:hypothetical protein